MVAGRDRHVHGPAPGTDARWLYAALTLILAFMAGEVIAGVAAHSLALISDAAHMLTDAASIALVLVTARLAARPPAGGYTYGLKRTEIMSAQANGITLVLLAAWLGYTAIRHLITPPEVTGGTMLVVALAGVAVNVAATLLIARAGDQQRGRHVDRDPGQRDDEHRAAGDLGRRDQVPDRGVAQPRREQHQRDAVGLRGHDLGALEAVGVAAGRRPGGQPRGDQHERDRRRVGQHVRRVGDQRERVRGHPRDDLAGHEGEDQRQGRGQPPGVRPFAPRRGAMHMPVTSRHHLTISSAI